MKVSKEEIVKLVLSLTPRERQEFKELYPSNFDYITLFNHICKNKSLDEKAFIKSLNKDTSSKDKNINVSVIKSYLLDKILNSLRSSYKNPIALAYQNLTYSDILISKGLYRIAESYLQETKNTSQTNNLTLEELLYLRQLEQANYLNNYIPSNEETANRFARNASLLDFLVVEGEVLHFAELLKSFFFYNIPPPTDTLFALFMKINSIDLAKGYPFFIEQQILLTKIAFEILQSENPNRLDSIVNFYADGIIQWKNNQHFMQYNGYWLLNLASGYFFIITLVEIESQQLDNLLDLLHLFEHKTKSYTEKIRAIELRYVCQMFQLSKSLEKHKCKEILRFKEKFKVLTEKGFTQTIQLKIWEEYTYIKTYLYLEQYENVIDSCNHLLHEKEYNVKNFMFYYAPVHFLHLQAHYELGNFKFLKYEIAKSKAILEKTIAFGEFEEEFFKLMKLLISTSKDNERMSSALIVHKTNFEDILKEGFVKAHFGIYNVTAWIEKLIVRFSK